MYGDNYSSGRGFNMRWLIGIVIVIAGVISYYTKTSINPTTGEKQRVALNPQQEMALGLQSAPQMAREMGGAVSPSDPRAQLVSEVGQRVMQNSDARNSPYVKNFHYILLNDPKTVNAFALPGGQVFITRGLLEKLNNEAELAGVLGHETGHVIERHSAQQMAKSQLGQSIVTGVAVGGSGNRDGGYSTAMIANFVNQMKQLSFSREDETQADTRGLQFMAQAGYDPRAMLGVMKVLEELSRNGRQPEMLQTHPYPEHRVQTIQDWLKKNYPNGVPSNLSLGRKLNFTSPQSDF
jgi:predicted Zn-dependent protease